MTIVSIDVNNKCCDENGNRHCTHTVQTYLPLMRGVVSVFALMMSVPLSLHPWNTVRQNLRVCDGEETVLISVMPRALTISYRDITTGSRQNLFTATRGYSFSASVQVKKKNLRIIVMAHHANIAPIHTNVHRISVLQKGFEAFGSDPFRSRSPFFAVKSDSPLHF